MTSPVRVDLPPPSPAAPAPQRPLACGLCGHVFVPGPDTLACARCPMARRCAVTCCPRCGYEFVTESRLVEFLRRLLRR